ncbi:MAG: acetyl-CoA C-acyltransferase [Gracilimonas sp.]|uniref:acetyl-CoA C-acyltransferase n=1 Tax=Gracilimonas TaxID=649462 RepID=UPI001B113A96|nr:acetyl-CoA C-acyltransferase [Gracilimonas sp.]MBO6585029.1 acetyl-CoA C-acyltransferase [Gracilimonas sp.]MBO6615700.1 acetyl-CoA C-acyltransferase [Gracilimonas sp.]
MENNTKHSSVAVLVDGCRIPFQRSGTNYNDLMAYDLGRMAIEGLLARNAVDPSAIDRVIMGTVIQEVKTSNVARESALGAGIPNSVPAFTTTMACISSNQAITSGVDLIRSGQAKIILAGGTETMSDIPVRFKKKFRQKVLEARKYKSPLDFLKFFKGLGFKDFLPELPAIAEFSTGEVMGESADRMAARFGVSREDQDEYALRSHQLAAKATQEGLLGEELIPAKVPPKFNVVEHDNGFRDDTSMEKLGKLRPAFIKPHGTVTAGNSSFLTDGASASFIMEEQTALELGLKPKAYIREYNFVSQDPGEELLLGPAYAIPKVLDAMKLKLGDMDVIELHEAFAGQVFSVLTALNSDTFAKESLNRNQKVGEIPMDKLNTLGGSLSLGHPFGATGVRLVTTAANRLIREDGTFALVSACAAGGQGHAVVLERYPNK